MGPARPAVTGSSYREQTQNASRSPLRGSCTCALLKREAGDIRLQLFRIVPRLLDGSVSSHRQLPPPGCAVLCCAVLPCCCVEFYPLPETTGTSLFTYAMAYGISSGLLDAETYLPVVTQAWSCLTAVSLHPDGTVGNCQPVGWAPTPDWGRDSSSSFCVGQFAMAASAVAQLQV